MENNNKDYNEKVFEYARHIADEYAPSQPNRDSMFTLSKEKLFRIIDFAINARNETPCITDFLNTTPYLSTRLQKNLAEYHNIYGNCPIKDVIKYNFMRVRDAGKKSWDEFENARKRGLSELTDSPNHFAN